MIGDAGLCTRLTGGGASISADLRSAMFRLLSVWFEGYGEPYFNEELDAIDHCIVQEEVGTGALMGFATITRSRQSIQGRDVGVFFTSHCIVDRRHWGSNALVRSMVGFMLEQVRSETESCRWYWAYSAVGYRSYRYLPALFIDYTPKPTQSPDPLDRGVRDWIGHDVFMHFYDHKTGMIEWNWDGYGLTAAAREIRDAKLESPGLTAFRAVNPRWSEGTEVLCLAHLSDGNLTKIARRWFLESSATVRPVRDTPHGSPQVSGQAKGQNLG